MNAADTALADARALWQEHPTQETFERLFRASVAAGRPLDSLDTYDPNEERRFFSRVIQGPDGHCYWATRGRVFHANGGRQINAARWWFFHLNGERGRGVLRPACGEANCIHPHHQVWVPWDEFRRFWTDGTLIGLLQVAASRLGRSPQAVEWDRQRREGQPSSSLYDVRFGGWAKALAAAGLEPAPLSGTQFTITWTAEKILDVLRADLAKRGRRPTMDEWEREYAKPVAATIVARFGSWLAAWQLASAA